MVARNVLEAILKYGHDEDFHPIADAKFLPTEAPAGSQEKIEVLRRRIELGQPLWHENDRVDYAGLTGAIQPREDKEEDTKNILSLSSLDLPNSYDLDDVGGEKILTEDDRLQIAASLKNAAKPILPSLSLSLAKALFELAEKSFEFPGFKEQTNIVDLVSAVAINRALYQETPKRQKAKITLAGKLDTDESALDKLLKDALASQQSTVFELLLTRPLGDIEKLVVQKAQRYFDDETREWQPNSLESMSATRLKGVGGLIQCILEPEKSVGPIHRQEQQESTEEIARQRKAAVIEETASGEFENVTLDKASSKDLAQGLWRKLQDDPKALYEEALALKKDKNMLPGESTEDYFKRLFLVALTGAYRNSDYPPVLKPLYAVSKFDNYFRDSFFFNLNPYLSRVEKELNAEQLYSGLTDKKAVVGEQIYQAIPLELFNIWATNPNWGPVLEARLTQQQTVNEISETLNLKLDQVQSIKYNIRQILPILKTYLSSQNKAPQLSH